MSDFYNVFMSDNFNELYRLLHRALLDRGSVSNPRSMPVRELLNVDVILENPRNRLLKSEVRKHNYTYAIGEFFWYLRGSNSLDEIRFYLDRMKEYSDDGITLNSAYGYRIFGEKNDFPNQWNNIIEELVRDQDSRRAVITINYSWDMMNPGKDVPCTLNWQFLIRDERLHMIVRMRSNDSFMGLIYDVYSFTMFQEYMLNQLNIIFDNKIKMGKYIHNAGSMHLYERDVEKCKFVLNEYQDFTVAPQDSFKNIDIINLLHLEKGLRLNNTKIVNKTKDNNTLTWMVDKLNTKYKP